jgi:hypothetical protein
LKEEISRIKNDDTLVFFFVMDMVSLKLFEDFLGLKSHLFEDFRPKHSPKSFISGA